MTQQEIADVRDLQREQITRVSRDVAVTAHRAGEVALQPGAGGRSMRPLTVVQPRAQRFDGLDALGEQRQRALLGGHDQPAPARRQWPMTKSGLRPAPLDGRQRVEEIADPTAPAAARSGPGAALLGGYRATT